MSFNRVILLGNLTRDVEMKFVANNKAVANIGLALNHKYTTADGEKREEVTFVDAEVWGKTAETINQYFSKGSKILIEGRLKLDQWKDQKDGTNRTKLKVVVESFSFVGNKKADSKPAPGTFAASMEDDSAAF